jgi:nucleoside 2-deoxyribosyltransferase
MREVRTMSPIATPRVYLAGPDVFRTDAIDIARAKKAICARMGFAGVFPMDAAPDALPRNEADAGDIYRVCIAHMEHCQILLADMTPFRGPSMDVGTAFEMGFAKARGMAVFSYSDVLGPYNGRVPVGSFDDVGSFDGGLLARDVPARDADGLLIEEFGLQDNLMVALCCDDGMTHPSLEAALNAAAAKARG